MSISKAHNDGEHRQRRAGNYSTHGWRNGHVPLPPKHAKDTEIYTESLDDLRDTLKKEIAQIESLRASGARGDERLKLRLSELRGHLCRVNAAKKNPEWRGLSGTFMECALLLLSPETDIIDRLLQGKSDSDRSDLEDIATSFQELLDEMEFQMAYLIRASESLCSKYMDVTPLLSYAIKELNKNISDIRKIIERTNHYIRSSEFLDVAMNCLSDHALNTLLNISDRTNQHANFRNLVKSAGGKKTYKSLREGNIKIPQEQELDS